MKHRVLLVSPPESYRIQPYVRAAHSLGVEVNLASQGEWAISSPHSAGVDVPLQDQEAALAILLQLARQQQYDAIVGTDDSTLELAAKLAEKTGLQQNNPSSVRIARRKDLSRLSLQQAGIQVPEFTVIEAAINQPVEDPQFDFPCVVKPLALSGSRGVIRADSSNDLSLAIQRSLKIIMQEHDLYEKSHLLIEQFISGREFAVEAMLNDERLEVLAIFDKPDPLDGPYFEETYYVSPARITHSERNLIVDTVQNSCKAYGLISGPVHAECRLNEDGAWLIELAARTIGGLCSRLLTFGTGYTLEQLVLANAIGQHLPIQINPGAAGVLMLPVRKEGVLRRVEGVMKAEQVPFIDEIEISLREGHKVYPLPEGASYLGFVFASAPEANVVEQALRDASMQLNPVIAPFWPVLNGKKEASA
ncbi:MAG: ATP-grasp domain-containing protein [Gammaproteobacteria bacterium]|nr:ATP-grasp domain-containing protein [Gammaproteobacteria bacterium]MDX2486819.1 ATP-grasp domain-containing protein [Gammaproteobacteria bacterium]